MFHRTKVTVCVEINTAHIDAEWAERTIVGRVRKIAKATIATPCPSICPPACNSSDPTGRIFIKLHSSLFFEHLSRKSKLH